MKKVRIVGRTNLRPDHVAQLAKVCDLVVYDTNVRTAGDVEELVQRVGNAEITVVNAYTTVGAGAIQRLPALRTLISCSSGIDHIDLVACGDAGVNVRWFPGYCARTLAEKALTCLLMGLTRIQPAIDDVRAGNWDYFGFQAREFRGRRIAVAGLGSAGRIVHDLCLALGFTVSPITSTTPHPTVLELLRSCDALTMHMDLNARSRHFLDGPRLSVLKDDVVIVNNARGGLIDEPAFAEWMQVHPAATAFLDVVAEEPLKPDHPFRRLPNIAVTPRIGWNSVEADAYLVQETFRSTMTAIDSGWTTADGEAGSLLLTEREQDAPL